jgi:hypothetical protein
VHGDAPHLRNIFNDLLLVAIANVIHLDYCIGGLGAEKEGVLKCNNACCLRRELGWCCDYENR